MSSILQGLAPPRIAVCIPCFNEALCIGDVLDKFRSALPGVVVHVFDNNSVDETVQIALAHGAQVTTVLLPGKGNVVRRMFADVEADIYVMVDGDATYDVACVKEHIDLLQLHGFDMLVGKRIDNHVPSFAYRPGHRWGNQMLTSTVAWLFGGSQFSDMLSGYRLFSRRYVKSFPAVSRGFEIETELTVHALELRIPSGEIPIQYRPRPAGSYSKLSTYRDGWRILMTAGKLVLSERPLTSFSILAGLLAAGSIALALPVAIEFFSTGLVPRLPTAVLATGMMLAAMLSAVCGAILNTVTIGRQELKRFFYLSFPAPVRRL